MPGDLIGHLDNALAETRYYPFFVMEVRHEGGFVFVNGIRTNGIWCHIFAGHDNKMRFTYVVNH